MSKRIYKANENFVLRTPIHSIKKYYELFENPELTPKNVFNLGNDPCFCELLKISSNDLSKNFLDTTVSRTDKLLYGCMKYAIRSSSRCTPYGLCAGVSVGKFGSSTDIKLASHIDAVKYARPDMEWLFSVLHKIVSDKTILPFLHVRRNPYTYEKGSRIVNPWYVNLGNANPDETHISIRNTKLVKYVLELSKDYILYRDLFNSVKREKDTVTEEKITAFLDQLIENEYLQVELYPGLVNNNPLQHVLSILHDIPTAKEWYMKLEEIGVLLKQYSSTSIGKCESILDTVFNKMGTLSPKKNYIQVDLKRPVIDDSLSSAISYEAQKFIELLASLSTQQDVSPKMTEFKSRFVEKYGYDMALPIVEVFDNDMGIGAPGGYAFPPSKQKDTLYHPPKSELEKYLRDKIQNAIRKNVKELSLTDDELEKFKSDVKVASLPDSMEVCLQVIADSVAALDNGDFQLMPTGFIGTNKSDKSFGRFKYMFPNLKNTFISKSHKILSDDSIDVELSEYPAHKRNCNVMLCASSCDYQLPLNIPIESATNIMDIKDVYVGVDSTSDSFYFKSAKNNKRLNINKNNLFNSVLGSNIYRFLCENSELPFLPISQTYSIFQSLPGNFVPRIVYDKIVLSPAKWRIPPAVLKQGRECIVNYKSYWEIPDIVYMVHGDNKLLLDLTNLHHVQLLIDLNSQKTDDILLTEAFNVYSSTWLTDVAGEPYTNEIILFFTKNYVNEVRKPSHVDVLQSINNVNDICSSLYDSKSFLLPGLGKWIYLKIYCDFDSINTLISREMYEWCQYLCKYKQIDKYFFIRYSDPDPHIRLRLHIIQNPEKLFTEIFSWQKMICDEHFISRIQIDTYTRETWRYGGENVIELAEDVFYRDSEVISKAIQCISDRELKELPFGIMNILSITQAFGLDREASEMWLSQNVSQSSYKKEFRLNRSEILMAIDTFYSQQNLINDIDLTQRTAAISRYKNALDLADREGTLTSSKSSILSSLIHMSLNRFKGNNTWERRIRALSLNGLYTYNQRKKHNVKI